MVYDDSPSYQGEEKEEPKMDDNIVFDCGKAIAYRFNYEVLRNDINTHLVSILVGHKTGDGRSCRTVSAREIKGFAFCSPADM
jgi:hypothetical protein